MRWEIRGCVLKSTRTRDAMDGAMAVRARTMAGTDDDEVERWRALQNRAIRERRIEENTHSRNEQARSGPRLPHKHAKQDEKGE